MSASILPFPKSGGKSRRAEGMGAAGLLSMMLLERGGEAIPANVRRLDEPEGSTLPERSPELLLALLVFSTLPKRQQERVRGAVRHAAYGDELDLCAVKLNNALNGRS